MSKSEIVMRRCAAARRLRVLHYGFVNRSDVELAYTLQIIQVAVEHSLLFRVS